MSKILRCYLSWQYFNWHPSCSVRTGRNEEEKFTIMGKRLKCWLCFLVSLRKPFMKQKTRNFNKNTWVNFQFINIQLSIIHSITRAYSLIYSFDSSLIESQKIITPRSCLFHYVRYSKRVSTLILTLHVSKFFSLIIPKSQSPVTKDNMAIRPKNIISSMMVLIPAIHENNWYVNCLCPFFPFAQWTQWRTVNIHRLFSHSFFFPEDRFINVVLKSAQFFFTSSCIKFLFQSSGWKESFKQVHRHYFILDSD